MYREELKDRELCFVASIDVFYAVSAVNCFD